MDIAKLSTTLKNIETNSKISIKVLDKAMETNEELGAGLVDMINKAAMERSVNPSVGSNFDMLV